MTDLGDIGEYDVVFSSHSLEHLYQDEVDTALREFHRVLRPNGCVVICVPDLEDVRASEEVFFNAPCGPITHMEMIYGSKWGLKESKFMAHHTGFTKEILENALNRTGFSKVSVSRVKPSDVVGSGWK